MASDYFSRMVRSLMCAGLVILAALLVFHPEASVNAQGPGSGTFGILSQMTPVFSGVHASSTCSAILPDIGQGPNILFVAQTNGAGGNANFDFEWSPSGVGPFYVITQANFADIATGTHVLTFSGYFPNLRTCLTTYSGGTWSTWYTASSGPVSYTSPALGTSGPTSPVTCDQSSVVTVANSTTSFIGPHPVNAASDTVIVCSVSIAFNGTTAAGSLFFEWSGAQNCSNPTNGFTDYTTASSPQNYSIPTQMRSIIAAGQLYNFLCVSNTSGATAAFVVNWASVHAS